MIMGRPSARQVTPEAHDQVLDKDRFCASAGPVAVPIVGPVLLRGATQLVDLVAKSLGAVLAQEQLFA